MFKNPFSFKGRIRRLEFGLSILAIYVVYFAVAFIGMAVGSEEMATILVGVAAIPLIIFSLAQGAKRCHDRGNSGFFQLIPFYGLWMLFADGEPGTNEYGPNPKTASGDMPEVAVSREY